MSKILISICLFICLGGQVFGQINEKISLITWECSKVIPDGTCYPIAREVVKYQFQNGALMGREVLLKADEFPFEFRFPSENAYIYQNRFLISDDGDVYDFEKKKTLFRSNGGALLSRTSDSVTRNLGLVTKLGDLIITRLSRSDSVATEKESFYSYNLKTNQYKKISDAGDLPKIKSENFSPNNKRLAVFRNSKYEFYQIDNNFKFKKIISVPFPLKNSQKNKDEADEIDPFEISIVWLDDFNILSVNEAGNIFKININGKITTLLKPKKVEGREELARITKDKFGNFLLYPCQESQKSCLIEVKKPALKKIDCDPIGKGFDTAYQREKDNTLTGQHMNNYAFFYNGKSIGKREKCWNAKSMDGYLATEYKDRNYVENRKGFIYVWNNIKNDWITIETKWHPEDLLIGWIKE